MALAKNFCWKVVAWDYSGSGDSRDRDTTELSFQPCKAAVMTGNEYYRLLEYSSRPQHGYHKRTEDAHEEGNVYLFLLHQTSLSLVKYLNQAAITYFCPIRILLWSSNRPISHSSLRLLRTSQDRRWYVTTHDLQPCPCPFTESHVRSMPKGLLSIWAAVCPASHKDSLRFASDTI